MKLHSILILAATAIAMGSCGNKANDELAHHHHDSAEAESEAHTDGTIVLSPEMAERLGVSTDTVRRTPMPAVVKVSGTIEAASGAVGTAVAPTAGIVTIARGIEAGSEVRASQLLATVQADAVSGGDVNRAARAELDAARAELDRVTPLWHDRLVTRAEYIAAQAAYERARAAYSSRAASGRVTAPISGVIASLDALTGSYVEAGSPVATVANGAELTLRAEVPARLFATMGDIADARITLPYADGRTLLLSTVGGRRNGQSRAAGAAGYVPVTFTFSSPDAIPGTTVDVYLISGRTEDALTVPASAIVEQQGTYSVYRRLDEDCYIKLPVTLGATDGERRIVTSGLSGGEDIVTRGTTAVTLAAASGNIPEGHSHSH